MKLSRLGMVALAAALTLPAIAQTAPTATDMQILAQKVKANKKLVVAVNMQLKERREFVASIPRRFHRRANWACWADGNQYRRPTESKANPFDPR